MPAFAGATTCLTGTDPEVVGDADEIRDARDIVDAACPCATYDGSDGFERGDYLACVKTALESPGIAIRKQCKGALKKIFKGSRCGRAGILAARPCIYESLADGKLSCKIRYTNKKDGSPNDKCVSNTKYTATPCSAHDFCLDAADTNQDVIIAAPGDDGTCYAPAGETVCQTLASASCSSTPGTEGTVLVGDVLTPGMIYRGGQVVIDDTGVIVHVGCASTCTGPCATLASTSTTVTCPDGAISPGLVNTHDHLTFTHNSPVVDSGERYEHRHDWRQGLNGHTEISVTGGATAAQVRWGELRALMAGTTSVIGTGGQSGLVRNLDSALQEGLTQTPAEDDGFPLGDSSGTQLASGCSYSGSMVEPGDIAAVDAYVPHISEGVDAYTRNEMTCLSQSPNDVILAKTAFVGGMALSPAQISLISSRGADLIWSPRSNISLYGNTAEAPIFHRFGVNISLGTDWMPTGSMNMLRELKCAASFDDDYLGDTFSDEDLWQMATQNPAGAAGFPTLGALEVGNPADIAIYDQATGDGYAAVVNAEPQSVLLVMRGGSTLFGDAPLAATLNGGLCDTVDVCGADKSVCVEDDTGFSLAALTVAAGPGIYPLFACGTPVNERTCVPSRPSSVSGSSVYTGTPSAGDDDADGVIDAGDNCVGIFNPIRPVDGGLQADADADGEGDVCDPCPMDADVTVCTFDPDDVDSDGVSNNVDNCPYASNVSQADADADQHGDACDECPSVANPGNAVCPELDSFGPSDMYIREGDTNAPTFAEPIEVVMNAPVAVDTFVAIDSSNPSALTVVGGGATVLAGQDSAVVLLNALSQAASVTLTASFDSTSLPTNVRVLGVAEQPELIGLTPATAVIASGSTQTLTVTLDIPAPSGGTAVFLSLTPSGAGVIPATVTVLENETQAQFDYEDNGSVIGSTITVEATSGADSFTSEITALIPSGDGLVINEVDYDNVGTDNLEFLEIHNPTASTVSLAGVMLYLVNGSDSSVYQTFDLSTAATDLPAGGYLVICPAAMSLPPSTPRIDIGDNTIQNGAPDGVALVDSIGDTLIDALSYEGAISMTTLPDVGLVTLLEGGTSSGAMDTNTTQGSLARLPNGNDTDNSSSDWQLSTAPTPGTSNVP